MLSLVLTVLLPMLVGLTIQVCVCVTRVRAQYERLGADLTPAMRVRSTPTEPTSAGERLRASSTAVVRWVRRRSSRVGVVVGLTSWCA